MRARKGRVGVQGKELETCRHRIDHATAAGRRVSNPAIIPGLFCRAAHSDNVREPLDWTQARTMPMTNDTAKEPMAGTTRVCNRGKRRGGQPEAQRCLTILGRYGISGWPGMAS